MPDTELSWESLTDRLYFRSGTSVTIRASRSVSDDLRERRARQLLRRVTELLKEVSAGWTAAHVRERMADEYVQLYLRQPTGGWRAAELTAIEGFLLPDDLGEAAVHAHIDTMSACVAHNAYFRRFLGEAERETFPTVAGKVETEKQHILSAALVYSLVLQRLTVAQRNDYRVLKACDEVWHQGLIDTGAKKNFDLFGFVKHESVKVGIDRILRYHETGNLPEDFLSVILPVNIVEACVADVVLGSYDNASAGLVLAEHGPNDEKDEGTDTGPARWSDDRKTILIRMPLPREWADLYHTWNLAFVSGIAKSPFHMAKLLIPQVANYKVCPEEYIYNRALALNAHTHRLVLGRWTFLPGGAEIDWSDGQVASFWGGINEKCAEEYEAQVDELNPSLLARLTTGLRDLFSFNFDP